MRDGETERQRDNSNLRTGSADSNEGLITVPPLVVEDYECSPRREWVRGRINSAGWWQDRSRRVNVAREWRLNDPRGQCGTGHDDRWKSFSQRHSSLCTGITNVCTQTCIRDELSESSEETRIRGTYAIIRKFPSFTTRAKSSPPLRFSRHRAARKGPSPPGKRDWRPKLKLVKVHDPYFTATLSSTFGKLIDGRL